MRASLILLLLLSSGCATWPLHFKATFDVWYKGENIQCERDITMQGRLWKTVCHISEELDISARPKAIDKDSAQIEILLRKLKNGKEKMISAPFLVNQPISISNHEISIKAERLP